MLIYTGLALAILGACAASAALTQVVLGQLQRRAILDRPGARSSHLAPTPRGGGIAVVTVVLVGWIIVGLTSGTNVGYAVALMAAIATAVVSWIDDLGGIGVTVRLTVQVGAVVATLIASPELALAFRPDVIGPLAYLAAAISWVWFINLYNFMDGIDGITGVETASIGLVIVLLSALGWVPGADGLRGAVIAGAALGFLVWNWHKARVFLGDVGSIPLGFLCGWLLLQVAAEGAWAAALIAPAYYLADATLTLGRRLLEGKTVWQAHREHFYQRAAASDGRHDRVVLRIAAANAALVVLAVVSVDHQWAALAAAVVVVAGLLSHLAALGRAPS